jgi:hypothetical protein
LPGAVNGTDLTRWQHWRRPICCEEQNQSAMDRAVSW